MVTKVGSLSSHTAGTSSASLTFSSAVPAGHTLVAFFAVPTAQAVTVGLSDSQGNTWTVQTQSATSGNYPVGVATCKTAAGLSTSDTLTLTITGYTSSTFLVSVADLGPVGDVDQTATISEQYTASPSITMSSAADSDHQYVLAGFSNTNTTHPWTVGDGFTSLDDLQDAEGSTVYNLHVEYQEVDAAGTRSAGGSFNPAATTSGVIIAVDADAPAPTAGFYYYDGTQWVRTVPYYWDGSQWIECDVVS